MSRRQQDPVRRPAAADWGARSQARPKPARTAGVPQYLEMKVRSRRPVAEHEAEAAAHAWRVGEAASVTPLAGPRSPAAAGIAARAGRGRPLDPSWRAQAEQRYGIDAGAVRLHDDPAAAALARGVGANALTIGNDIFFGAGRYAPASGEGERILAHELAHVAQQRGEPRAIQGDLAMSLGVPLGGFEIDMATQASGPASNAGLMGTIAFQPEPTGPYSAEIGLVQAVNVTDVAGATAPAGQPLNWANDVPGGGPAANPEAGRMELMTPPGLGAAPQGWFIDSRTANARGTSITPNYIEHFISPEPQNQYGYLRSPTDVRPASLWDFPQSPHDVDFDFETVAKGTDNQTVYGSLFWGFQIRSGAVPAGSEYAHATGTASATFEEALERYRGFFVHEPVVLYFDTDVDAPIPGEETKLADVPDYLARYPDVNVSIDGWADLRGSEAHNFDLAQRRANAVQAILLAMGVDRSRIVWCFGMGETTQFSEHGTPGAARQRTEPGLLHANRRVVVSFEHTMSGYPIVMP